VSQSLNQLSMKALFVGPGKSLCCTIVSAIGVVFLFVLGALFQAGVEELTEGPTAPADHLATASSCFIAGAIYLFLFVFCFWQVRAL